MLQSMKKNRFSKGSQKQIRSVSVHIISHTENASFKTFHSRVTNEEIIFIHFIELPVKFNYSNIYPKIICILCHMIMK